MGPAVPQQCTETGSGFQVGASGGSQSMAWEGGAYLI